MSYGHYQQQKRQSLEEITNPASPASFVRVQQPTLTTTWATNGDSFSYTPTVLVSDVGPVTWSAVDLPGWASLNTTTGEITGTAATGRTRFKLTYTDNGLTDELIITIHVVANTIDLAGGSFSAAEVLSNADTRYRLLGDVTFETSAFVVAANNIILDLNGFTVTYDDLAQESTLTNGDFATGTTTGWDLTGAAAATTSIISGVFNDATAYRQGDNSLEIIIPAATTITFETTANHSFTNGNFYAFSFWSGQQATDQFDDFNITVEAGTKSSSTLSGSDDFQQASVFRPGEITMWSWNHNATESVPVQITIENTNATLARTIYVGEFSLSRGLVHGIVNASDNGYAPYTAGVSNRTDFSVMNGTLTQSGNSALSTSVWTGGTRGATVDGLTINNNTEVMTVEHGRIFLNKAFGCSVTNCNMTTTCEKITDRDNNHGYPVISTLSTQGDIGVHFRANTINGSPQGGFFVNATAGSSYDCQIRWNTVNMKARYTNAFGISGKADVSSSLVSKHNIINGFVAPDGSGRGIMQAQYFESQFNTVVVQSREQIQEYYGFSLGGAYAWQSEKATLGQIVANETYKTQGGDGGGSCFRYNGASGGTLLDVNNCSFEVDSTTSTPDKNFSCVKFGAGGDIPDPDDFTFTDCTFKTNHKLFDIPAGMTGTLTFINPHFHIVNDSAYIAGEPWYPIGAGTLISIVNPTYEDAFTQSEIESEEAIDASVTIT